MSRNSEDYYSAILNVLHPIKSPRGLNSDEIINAYPELWEQAMRSAIWVLISENKIERDGWRIKLK